MINRVKAAWKFITSPDYSRTVGILALLVVVLAIPLTVFIAQKQQEIRQRAQTTCNDTYDGSTFAQQGQQIQDNFRAAYGDQAETKWIQERNAALATNAPKANDGKTLFDEPDCGVIRSFYSAYGSNAPQQWVTQHNGNGGGAPAPTATPPPSTIVHQEFEPCPSNTACSVTSPNIIDRNDRSKDLYCRKIGSSTNEEFEWITQQYANAQCSSTQIGRTAECGGTTYYCNGRPGGWTTTQPPAPTAAPTAVPTLAPTPIPVELCGKMCSIFRPGSIKEKSECEREGYYIDPSDYDSGTKTCNFACLPIPDFGTSNKLGLGGCSYSAIRPTSPPPPPGDGGDDGGGAPAPGPGPGPGAPAPQPGEPTGALTKLLFDLILPQGSKDKRVVAQIFTATPVAQMGEDLEGTAKRGPGGNHTGTVDVANTIASGTYDIKVKADKYLRKLIQGVQITQNTTTRISQITLTLGDINGDNKLNIADYNILIDCFGAKANSQTCGNSNKDLADLDDNGRVDGVDYNLFLINLSKGPRDGD